MDPADKPRSQEQFMQMFGNGNRGVDPEKDPFNDMLDWQSYQEDEDPDLVENEKPDAKDEKKTAVKECKERDADRKESDTAEKKNKKKKSLQSHEVNVN